MCYILIRISQQYYSHLTEYRRMTVASRVTDYTFIMGLHHQRSMVVRSLLNIVIFEDIKNMKG